jgi:hypothetical protein
MAENVNKWLSINNHWVSGLCPYFRFQNTRKHHILETGGLSSSKGRETPALHQCLLSHWIEVNSFEEAQQSRCHPLLT